jgi:type II secretory pathway pseudopilin PulG
MWRKSRLSSTCGRPQRGAIALLLVLGVMTILLVLGAVAANSARQELRLSRGEALAEQVAILVEAGFNQAAKQADLDRNWPTTPFVAGATPCIPSAPYPSYCIDAMARRPYMGTWEQIPIRVAYRVSATEPVAETYGWIVAEITYTPSKGVVRIVPNRAWCEPATESGTGPCAYGS